MEHVFRVLRPSTPLTESMTNRNSAEDEQSFGKIMEKMDLLPSEPLPSPESENQQFPRNHPLSGSKHLCAICEDRASGKHYGVYSCEGCKGFFKRTVRKDLVYACRDEKKCIVDKRQRNRCQYCRYQKCLSCGMKREAVQEEKQRGHKRMEDLATTSSTTVPGRLLMDAFSQADERSESRTGNKMIPYLRSANSSAITREDGVLLSHLCDVINNQLYQMVEFACQLQYFTFLRRPDQILLLKSCWLELLVVNVSYRTTDLLGSEDIAPKRPKDTKPQQLGVGPSLIVHRSKAQRAGVQVLFDRILAEVCVKMKRLSITKAEVQCLKGIILFNPDIRDLADRYNVGCSREAIYENLTEHCRINYPLNDARFGQLLLLLPPIRSISIRCRDHLFFFRLTGEKPIEKYFSDLIETILDIRN